MKGKPNRHRSRKVNSKRSIARRRRDRPAVQETSEISGSSCWNTDLFTVEEDGRPQSSDFLGDDDVDAVLLEATLHDTEGTTADNSLSACNTGLVTTTTVLSDDAMDSNPTKEDHAWTTPQQAVPRSEQSEPYRLNKTPEQGLPPLCYETVRVPKEPSSTRVLCDVLYLVEQARKLEHHGFNCSGKLYCKKIVKIGLVTKLHYQCNKLLCSETVIISTEKQSSGINYLAVLGALATGSGYSQEEEKFATLGVRYMTQPVFAKCEIEAGKVISSCTEEVLKISIDAEKKLAQESGSVDSNGFACIAAVVDGGWCKRSYGHGYNASSGVAVIIGASTQKILFIGVRNKLCLVCNAIESGKIKPKEHVCFKNWRGASTAMEPDIIVEGLNYLEKVHNVRCLKLIGDGDSNIMTAVTERVSFGRAVEKLECANHAVRRYSRAIDKLSKDTRRFCGKAGIAGRKILSARIARLAVGARSEIKRHAVPFLQKPSQKAIETLKKGLRNGPSHVFGKHDACGDWCTRKENDPDGDVFSKVQDCGILSAVEGTVNRVLVCDAQTLVFNATNNPAEHFMSQLAKTYGGKRVDHSRAGGINRRSRIATLAYSAKGPTWHSPVHKGLTGKSPNTPLRKFILKRKRSHNLRLRARQLFKDGLKTRQARHRPKDRIARGGDKNYGDNPACPDINTEEMKEQSDHFLSKLAVCSRDELEKATRGQAENDRWREETQAIVIDSL